mmetsp:Transcript_2271/g.6692  ORF Transcript_2271/g.6692 Transcript_2271/m.6692 type:complete len:211 (-) Transcript_2271:83-715(-)
MTRQAPQPADWLPRVASAPFALTGHVDGWILSSCRPTRSSMHALLRYCSHGRSHTWHSLCASCTSCAETPWTGCSRSRALAGSTAQERSSGKPRIYSGLCRRSFTVTCSAELGSLRWPTALAPLTTRPTMKTSALPLTLSIDCSHFSLYLRSTCTSSGSTIRQYLKETRVRQKYDPSESDWRRRLTRSCTSCCRRSSCRIFWTTSPAPSA